MFDHLNQRFDTPNLEDFWAESAKFGGNEGVTPNLEDVSVEGNIFLVLDQIRRGSTHCFTTNLNLKIKKNLRHIIRLAKFSSKLLLHPL